MEIGHTKKPLISVMIPVYNRGNYLVETLESVLCQDLGAELLHIMVVDDGSTEDIETIVNKIGNGRVEYFRQKQNVGQIKNFETCIALCKGEWLHILHGDDKLLFGFYKRFSKVILENVNPKLGAIFCRHVYINAIGDWLQVSSLEQNHDGILENQIVKICTSCIIQTPSILVKQDVYDKIGSFDQTLGWSEDWEMWSRISCHFDVYYIKQPLAQYRFHSDSTTGKNALNFSFPEETKKTQAKIVQSVPLGLKEEVIKIGRTKAGISLYLELNKYKNLTLVQKIDYSWKYFRNFPSSYNMLRVIRFFCKR
jgi:glycosyltransferase involved in cell wall biosynthesis